MATRNQDSRGSRMLQIINDRERLESLASARYDSTKGTTKYEQSRAIECIWYTTYGIDWSKISDGKKAKYQTENASKCGTSEPIQHSKLDKSEGTPDFPLQNINETIIYPEKNEAKRVLAFDYLIETSDFDPSKTYTSLSDVCINPGNECLESNYHNEMIGRFNGCNTATTSTSTAVFTPEDSASPKKPDNIQTFESPALGTKTPSLNESNSTDISESNDSDSDYGQSGNSEYSTSDTDKPISTKKPTVENPTQVDVHKNSRNAAEEDSIPHNRESVEYLFTDKQNNIILPKPCKIKKRRIYDKKQACLYCQRLYSKLPQHIEIAHPEKKEVADILKLSRKSKERANKLRQLRNKGNFLHNTKVLKDQVGSLIVCRRSTKDSFQPNNYLPCEYCFAFFHKRKLWHHVQQCPDRFGKKSLNRKSAIKNGRLITPVNKEASSLFNNNILKHMRDGEEKTTIMNDVTLCIFGSKEAIRNKLLPQQKNHISYKLRLLAKLILHLKKENAPISKIAHCVLAENFDVVTNGVVKISLEEDKPSLGTKMGHHLKKCAKIVRNKSIIGGDNAVRKKVEDFLTLYEDEWDERVSKPAKDILDRRRYTKKIDLPSTEDIMKFNSVVKGKEQEFIERHFENVSYSEVAKVTLAHVITFNRRRPGEVSLLEVESYVNRVKATEPQGEVEEMLSNSEKKMFSELDIVYLRGKKGAKVDCLLTGNMVKCMNFLIERRESSGILPENPYLFCLPHSEHCMRGCDAIKEISNQCGAKLPSNLKSTKLRKHISTVSQLLNLDEGSFNSLCKHLGHNPKVHREFYQMPQEMVLKTQISKILVALDQGSICKYKGKSLSEFEVNLNESNILPETTSNQIYSHKNASEKAINSDYSDSSEDASLEPSVEERSKQKYEVLAKRKQTIKGKKKVTARKNWSQEDIAILKEFFTEEILVGVRPPTKKRCEECIVTYPHFKERGNYLNIKWRVNSIIQENNKRLKR